MNLPLILAAGDPLASLEGGLDLSLAERATGLIGVAVFIGLAYLLSYDRKHVNWRLVGMGLLLQTVFGLIVLRTDAGRVFFQSAGSLVNQLLLYSDQGSRFVFGDLIGNTVPVGIPDPDNNLDTSGGMVARTGALFAFQVLPIIIFLSALTSVLYYLGIMQVVVRAVAFVMQKTLGTSGAETLSASGNIFVGQTEAPLLIKPFIGKMTRSELNTVMTGGFATVAGSVLGVYVAFLRDDIPSIAGHLIAASVMNAPAGLLLSKIILPERETPVTGGKLELSVERSQSNVIDAAAEGASTGARLAINVAAMLMAFVALVALANGLVAWVGSLLGMQDLTIQWILGQLARPLAWAMGVPWADTTYVGGLLGIKVILTEFLAYLQFSGDIASQAVQLTPRSTLISTYALLGFANVPSIAIQIGGISGLAPERRGELAQLGLRAMIAGNLAAFLSASLAGMIA